MAIINIFEFEVCCLIYVGVRRRGGGGGTVRRSECDDLYAPSRGSKDGRGRRLEVESAARALLYSCCFLRWSLSLAHHPLRRLPRSLPLLPSFLPSLLTSFARRGEARRCDLAVLGLARSRPHTAFGFAFDDATAKQEFLSSAEVHQSPTLSLSRSRSP